MTSSTPTSTSFRNQLFYGNELANLTTQPQSPQQQNEGRDVAAFPSKNECDQQNVSEAAPSSSYSLPILDPASLEFADRKKLSSVLGGGANGMILSAILSSPEGCQVPVAVKTFQRRSSLDAEIEISTFTKFQNQSHPNIVRCFGIFVSSTPTNDSFLPHSLVLEPANKNLAQHIAKSNHLDLSAQTIANFASQIAQGMHFLHSGAPKELVHMDLKPNNILVFENPSDEKQPLTLKLCDFGAVRPHNAIVTKVCGTDAFLPPEVFLAKLRRDRSLLVNQSFDVFAFGLVLLELLEKSHPCVDPGANGNSFFDPCWWKGLGELTAMSIHEEQNRYEDFDEVLICDDPDQSCVPMNYKEIFLARCDSSAQEFALTSSLVDLAIECLTLDPKGRPQNGMQLLEKLHQMPIVLDEKCNVVQEKNQKEEKEFDDTASTSSISTLVWKNEACNDDDENDERDDQDHCCDSFGTLHLC